MGMANLYDHIEPEGIGRDRFIELLKANGFQLGRKRSFKRTTISHPSKWYPNLITGSEFNGVNQVWVSDITYIRVGEVFYYLTMIMDLYSRRILGWSLSENLGAESNMVALRMALKSRKGEDLSALIHHSDRGSQFLFTPYRKLLRSKGARISMGNKAWENAHAERINGTIKLDYIYPYQPRNRVDLRKKVKKSIVLYNEKRKHSSLGKMTPKEFEIKMACTPEVLRPVVKINY